MLVIDISEFLRNPIRTGIQRTERELLKHWPRSVPARIVWFDDVGGWFREVPSEVVDYLIEQAQDAHTSAADIVVAIAPCLAESTKTDAIVPGPGDRVLVSELFSSHPRCRHYRWLHARGAELRPVIADLLLWTIPNAWSVLTLGALNEYLALMFLARERAFSSRAMRDQFQQRFLRGEQRDDPVITLGADSLPRSQGSAQIPLADSERKPMFVCAGTLDGKKGQDAVYSAFLASAASRTFDLVFVGKVPEPPPSRLAALMANTHPRVSIVEDPDDLTMASIIERSQASIFISRHEGFGLPAIESLYLGTPVVAAADLPALSNLPPHGQIRLRGDSQRELIDAMNVLAEPGRAAQLRAEIAALNLPTWRAYAQSIADWAIA